MLQAGRLNVAQCHLKTSKWIAAVLAPEDDDLADLGQLEGADAVGDGDEGLRLDQPVFRLIEDDERLPSNISDKIGKCLS